MSQWWKRKLEDERWKAFAAFIKARDFHKCVKCLRGKVELHAHHTYYEGWIDPWDYPPHSVISLCKTCHFLAHIGDEPEGPSMGLQSSHQTIVENRNKCALAGDKEAIKINARIAELRKQIERARP